VAQADAAKLPEAKVASSAAKVESAPPAIHQTTRRQPRQVQELSRSRGREPRRLRPSKRGGAHAVRSQAWDSAHTKETRHIWRRHSGGLSADWRTGPGRGLRGTGEREADAGPGLAAYRRLSPGRRGRRAAKLGPGFRRYRAVSELTLLTLNGKQLATGEAATGLGAAADLRARLGIAWGRVAPFLFAGVSYDLRQESLTLDDRPQTILTLSALERQRRARARDFFLSVQGEMFCAQAS